MWPWILLSVLFSCGKFPVLPRHAWASGIKRTYIPQPLMILRLSVHAAMPTWVIFDIKTWSCSSSIMPPMRFLSFQQIYPHFLVELIHRSPVDEFCVIESFTSKFSFFFYSKEGRLWLIFSFLPFHEDTKWAITNKPESADWWFLWPLRTMLESTRLSSGISTGKLLRLPPYSRKVRTVLRCMRSMHWNERERLSVCKKTPCSFPALRVAPIPFSLGYTDSVLDHKAQENIPWLSCWSLAVVSLWWRTLFHVPWKM